MLASFSVVCGGGGMVLSHPPEVKETWTDPVSKGMTQLSRLCVCKCSILYMCAAACQSLALVCHLSVTHIIKWSPGARESAALGRQEGMLSKTDRKAGSQAGFAEMQAANKPYSLSPGQMDQTVVRDRQSQTVNKQVTENPVTSAQEASLVET